MADRFYPNTLDLGATGLIGQLWAFKEEQMAPAGASTETVAMFAGRDNIHGSLAAALRSVRSSLVLNMYGFDDPELAEIIWGLIQNPKILVQITLDKSQAGGLAERKILDGERVIHPGEFGNQIMIGTSATHQISHTKAGVIDGVLAFHGSVNWSTSGEGIFKQEAGPGGVGYKAQNNSLSWHTDRLTVNAFRDELAHDRAAMQAQIAKTAA